MTQGWVTDRAGYKCHYVDDVIHNDNGPAIISYLGTKEWYINGIRHRKNGAAIEWVNGNKSWWYEGKCLGDSWMGYNQEKFKNWINFKVFL